MKSRLIMSLVAVASLFAGNALADDVVWNYNNQAIASGTACASAGAAPDTYFVAAGSEISVVFSRLGVALENSTAPYQARRDCAVRIPLMIAKGKYVGTLVQQLFMGVNKTVGTSGGVTMRATFFNAPAATVTHNFPYGVEDNNPQLVIEKTNRYQINQIDRWCQNASTKGFYQFNLATTASRDSLQDFVVLQIDGADLRFTASAIVEKCEI